MRSDRAPLALALAAAGVGTVSATILPYIPTTIFLSPNDSSVAYIIDDRAGNLLTLNISSTIKAGDIDAIITNKLPFSGSDTSISYTPSISPSGSIGIYAGSCDSNSSLWTYPYSTSDEGAGWSEISISDSSSLSTLGGGHGPGYLASSFYFSTNVETDDTNRSIYTFGGMCPIDSAADEETLQAGANYTNRMLKLSPLARKWPLAYEASLSAVTGLKPVPEAGFTMTALQPTYSNSSSGHVTQAQTYVVIGGHTEGAFIGMNQVALFSLPQESWTFQSVSTGSSEPSSELATIERRRRKYATVPASSDGRVAKRQSDGVPDSRSGHTAVLSSDGSKIIVFGGWVGDVNTPAEPLLAILHLGSGFGGVGAWSWELPEINGTEFGLGKQDGIYGHGAIMLPGDILMFAGGKKIAPTESKTKRADSGLQAMFLDTTSMTWTGGYTNPNYDPSNPSAPGQSGSGDTSKKVAIGTGVGVGIAAIFGAVALFFWYRRRLNRKHVAARDRDLAALSQATHRDMAFYGEQAEMQQRIGAGSLGGRTLSQGWGFGGGSGIDAYTGAAYGPIEYQGYDHGHVEEGGVSYVQPQQPGGFQIPRKPANIRNARGVHQPAPLSQNNQYSNFELGIPHSRTNSLGTAGAIHPIYEADEDGHGDMANTNLIDAQRLHDLPGPSPVESNSDPFQDPEMQRRSRVMPILELPPRSPLRGRNATSPERYDMTEEEREREIKEWVSDWAAADAYAMGHTASTSGPHGTRNTQSLGHLSPSKDTNSYSGRTDSNLSDQSAVTLSRNDSSGTRTKSLTAFFTGGGGWGMFGSGNMPQGGSVNHQPTIINNEYLGPASGRVTAESYYPSGSTSPEGDSRNSTLTASGPAGTLQPPKSSGNGSNKSGSSGNSGSHQSNGSHITAQSHITTQSHISAGFIGLKEQAENLLPRPGAWEPGSPSKSKGLKRRSPGWLGSIKRALGREEWVGSPGTEPEDRENLPYDGVGYGGYADSPSPTRTGFDDWPYVNRAYNDESFPTRTASASASLWRRKQGRGGWEDSPDERAFAGGVQRNFTVAVPSGAYKENRAEDEEWDVEKAVQGRQVQVMFTVPKERLRVVNHDVSDDESDIGMVRKKTRSPVRDLLSGGPIRGGTPTLERQLSRLSGRSQIRPESSASTRMPAEEGLEMLNMGESMDKGKGNPPEHDVPLPLSPVRHLPPPLDVSFDVPQTRSQSPLRLDTSQELPPRTTASPKPPSPLKHLPPPREDTKSPALSVKLKHVDDPISRSGSPAKSLRSVRSGKVADMVKQMEEIAKSPEI